jgi:hypothetical protein
LCRCRIGLNSPLFNARLLPKLAGNFNWINAGLLPPSLFIADTVNCAVMDAAEWNCEFITRLAAERSGLHESQVMRIGWLAAAKEARLLRHEAQVFLVAVASRGAQGEHALIDPSSFMAIAAAASPEGFGSRRCINSCKRFLSNPLECTLHAGIEGYRGTPA